MSAATAPRRRGGPLAILGLLLVSWVAARAALWESPFALPDLPGADILFAGEAPQLVDREDMRGEAVAALQPASSVPRPTRFPPLQGVLVAAVPANPWLGYSAYVEPRTIAAGHEYLMRAAFAVDWNSSGLENGFVSGRPGRAATAASASAEPPFQPRPTPSASGRLDRWSLDSFAFYRAGSASLSPSQGRTPVYGASQLSANLQYRIAPRSGHDPRAYLRTYRSLTNDPESELAAGLSARPLRAVPVRLAGEIRALRNAFGTDFRPAGYAVAELPAQRMPLGFRLETYGAAGYVGGDAATYFVDGQAALTREVVSVERIAGDQPVRFSIGTAAWGGAQEDAGRLDVGPTMRIDLTVGEVPARISVDWREQVAGDATPDSGVAATISTRF